MGVSAEGGTPDNSAGYPYNKTTYGELDISDESQLTKENINGVLHWSVHYINGDKYRDDTLQLYFQETFEGWTAQIFAKANKKALQDLRTHLRCNGVYIHMQAGRAIHLELAAAVIAEEFHNWTESEVQYQYDKYPTEDFKSKFNPAYATATRQSRTTAPRPPTNPAAEPDKKHSSSPEPDHTMHPYNPQQPVSQSTAHQQQSLPTMYARELGNFVRMYREEMKYGGAEDSLSVKLHMFYDNCQNAGLPVEAYTMATPTILKGQTQKYYYRRLAALKLGHYDIVDRFQEHFETEARRQ